MKTVMRCGRFSLAVFAVAVGMRQNSLAQGVQEPSGPAGRVHEELIAEVPAQSTIGTMVTVGSQGVLWIEGRPGHKQALRFDGKRLGGEYDEVRDIASSKDARQVSFTARRGAKWLLVINGKDSSAEYDEVGVPDITSDGNYVMPARENGKWQMLANGKPIGPEVDGSKLFREQPVSNAVFDESGIHYAFALQRHGKWMTFVDGKEAGVEMERIRTIMSKGSMEPVPVYWVGQYAFVAEEINHQWRWVVDGHPEPAFDVLGMPRVTPDGKHYAYAAVTWGKGGSIVKDGTIIATHPDDPKAYKEWHNFRGVWPMRGPAREGVTDPVLATDGTLFYAARRGENDVVVSFHGVPGPSFSDIDAIAVTADGKHIVYRANRSESQFLVRDQVALPGFPKGAVQWIKLSDDGSHVAYDNSTFAVDKSLSGLTDTTRVFVDGKADPEFQAYNRAERIQNFKFSEDGRHYLYQVHTFRRKNCWFSKNCAGEDQRLLIVDGVQLGAYDDVLPGADFVDQHTIRFRVHQGNRLVLVTYTLD